MDEMGSELCFSDMVIVDRNKNSIVRYYMASYFRQWMFRVGWLPPHPTILLKRSIFSEFGMYSTEYKLAGDFDFLVRIFYARKIDWSYLNRITVMMRAGGASNDGLLSKFRAMIEINRSLRNNGVFSTYFFQLVRYLIRLVELVVRPNINMCSSVNSVLKSPPYNRVLKNSPAEPNIENHQP